MSGRAEQDLKREQWIERKLNEYEKEPLLRDYMRSSKKKTPATRKAYLGYLMEYVDFMEEQNVKLTEVIPMYIDRFVDHASETGGPGIINAKLAAIIDFNKFLKKNGFIRENPCTPDMKLKIEEKDTVTYMTELEVDTVKHAALDRNYRYKNRDLCIITLGCATGLRVSAIVNIDIEDIDFDDYSISVIEKGKYKRTVFIGENTMNVIKHWMRDRQEIIGNNEGALFISQKKNRMSVRAVQDMIHSRSAGIDKHITPHKMRSTCAMSLYEKTGDIYLTAQQLGHKSISNTTKYAKATETKRREAALLLD